MLAASQLRSCGLIFEILNHEPPNWIPLDSCRSKVQLQPQSQHLVEGEPDQPGQLYFCSAAMIRETLDAMVASQCKVAVEEDIMVPVWGDIIFFKEMSVSFSFSPKEKHLKIFKESHMNFFVKSYISHGNSAHVYFMALRIGPKGCQDPNHYLAIWCL